MDRIHPLLGPWAASLRLRSCATIWLVLQLPSRAWGQSGNPFERLQLPDASTLLVLGAGFGVVLIAAGVLVFAIRQLRHEAAERRRLYHRHRRGGHVHHTHLGPPPTPTAD